MHEFMTDIWVNKKKYIKGQMSVTDPVDSTHGYPTLDRVSDPVVAFSSVSKSHKHA